MFKKVSQSIFILLFLAMIAIPLITTNLQENKVSEAENRKLAPMAKFYNEDGSRNEKFMADFETWINDNIGQRSNMVINNAKIQYYLFRVLANNSNMYLGPNEELNYANQQMLLDYQHLNLYTDEKLQEIAESMQYLSEYVENKGAKFYYYQCWDKHSIYPEDFPDSVVQIGTESKTDGIIKALERYSSVDVITPKQELIDEKLKNSTYSVWGDPTHWNPRGAYIGYKKLMDNINTHSDIQYKILQESDYIITIEDQGDTLFGGIHKEDLIEDFQIKDPKAVLTNEKLTLHSEDQRHRCYTNDYVDNETRLLIIGDSYFDSYIMDDLAESFYETIMIRGDYLLDFQEIIDSYDADIVVIEAAERVDRTGAIVDVAQSMKGMKY